MSNKNGTLEAISVEAETKDYTFSEAEKLGKIDGLKTVYTVDFINKRRIKNSIPSLILAELEGGRRTAKDVENALFRKNNKALRTAKEKLGVDKDFRAYLARRIKAVFRYYLNDEVRADLKASAVIRELIDGKAFYSLTLRYIAIK